MSIKITSMFDDVQAIVAKELRTEFGKDFFVSGEELIDTPASFPAVAIYQSDQYINAETQDLETLDIDRTQTYTVWIYSNSRIGKEQETQVIADVLIPVMTDLRYRLATNFTVPSMDASVCRRILRFTCDHVVTRRKDG